MKKAVGWGSMALSLLLFLSAAKADTTFVAGQVSGVWTQAGSPYYVMADCEVPYGQTLTIEPGVQVKFVGHYKLALKGALTAVGAVQDTIWFAHAAPLPTNTWAGLRFDHTEGASNLAYCKIESGHAQGSVGQASARGGGVSVDSASVNITHCRIFQNRADVKGGGIYLRYANSIVDSCQFVSNASVSDGGAIFVEYCTNVTISNNLMALNTADNGAGMHYVYSLGVIEDNRFEMNYANTMNGGGIYLDHSSPLLQRNSFIFNVAAGFYGAGIFCANSSSPQILYNEICSNNSGLTCVNASSPQIDNNTVAYNGGRALSAENNSNPFGRNNIFYGNLLPFYIGTSSSIFMTYSDIQGGWPGFGNFDANPNFIGNGSFYLMPFSPCIDAGSPLAPLDPDSTIADQGAHYFDQNQPQGTCTIQLTPFGAPIILRPSGGTVTYGVSILNSPDYYNLFDGWINLQQPDGQIVPLVLRSNLYLLPGGNLTRALSLTISASAMPGTYTVTGYVGDHPSTIEDFDSFTFVKSASGDDEIGQGGIATLSGWGETETVVLKSSLPQETRLLGHYPEPFNPTATIRYQLSSNSLVSLRVYDTAGKLVKTLVDGWRSAGEHELTFDAGDLPSGMYFAKLEVEDPFGTGNYVGVQKLILLK